MEMERAGYCSAYPGTPPQLVKPKLIKTPLDDSLRCLHGKTLAAFFLHCPVSQRCLLLLLAQACQTPEGYLSYLQRPVAGVYTYLL